MATYAYTVANDAPVSLRFTIRELRTICDILQREVERKGSDRLYARDLHAQLQDALRQASASLTLEGSFIERHTIAHLSDGMNDAIEKSEAEVD